MRCPASPLITAYAPCFGCFLVLGGCSRHTRAAPALSIRRLANSDYACLAVLHLRRAGIQSAGKVKYLNWPSGAAVLPAAAAEDAEPKPNAPGAAVVLPAQQCACAHFP